MPTAGSRMMTRSFSRLAAVFNLGQRVEGQTREGQCRQPARQTHQAKAGTTPCRRAAPRQVQKQKPNLLYRLGFDEWRRDSPPQPF